MESGEVAPTMGSLMEIFTCETCGKSWDVKSKLDIHMRCHTGERPYTCNVCQRTFNVLSNLRRHFRTVHTVHRPFSCDICGKSFNQNSNLKRHLKVHKGSRNSVPLFSLTKTEETSNLDEDPQLPVITVKSESFDDCNPEEDEETIEEDFCVPAPNQRPLEYHTSEIPHNVVLADIWTPESAQMFHLDWSNIPDRSQIVTAQIVDTHGAFSQGPFNIQSDDMQVDHFAPAEIAAPTMTPLRPLPHRLPLEEEDHASYYRNESQFADNSYTLNRIATVKNSFSETDLSFGMAVEDYNEHAMYEMDLYDDRRSASHNHFSNGVAVGAFKAFLPRGGSLDPFHLGDGSGGSGNGILVAPAAIRPAAPVSIDEYSFFPVSNKSDDMFAFSSAFEVHHSDYN